MILVMKKLSLLLMPLMAVSLLANCEQPKPTPDVFFTITFNGTNPLVKIENIKPGSIVTEGIPEVPSKSS